MIPVKSPSLAATTFYFIPGKSITGEFLALGLHLGVFGTGLGPDGPGCPETFSNDQYDHA